MSSKFKKIKGKFKRKHFDHSGELSAADSDASGNQSGSSTKKKKYNSHEKIRQKQQQEAIAEEDRNIKRLEKLLKLNKRKKEKKNKLPTIFKDDGLDYILDFVERKGDSVFSDCSDEIGDDLAAARSEMKKPAPKEQKPNLRLPQKKRTLTELLKEKGDRVSGDEVSTEEDECRDSEDSDENNTDDNEESAASITDKESRPKKSEIWEDIYGRLRDESGSVVRQSTGSNQKYVPPSLMQKTSNENEACVRIKRQLKGLLNRLSEANLQNICHQIEDLYAKYSRNDMNETLFTLMSELLFTPILTPPRLIMEQAMLVALLHANVGSEIGAYFLQHVVNKIGELFQKKDNYGDQKECNNLLIFLSHLYNFKVTHCILLFDIFQTLIESFQSKDIELIQMLLKNIGFALRKDDPLKLKEIILSIQSKSSSFTQGQNDSRIKFMLETLTAIRNNNMYKIPDYDPSIVEHSKRLLKGMIRKGCTIQELSISYNDLMHAEDKGRWWIVGSAWIEDDKGTKVSDADAEKKQPQEHRFSEKILDLARKQHMNTEVRKSVFCIIMTAEDFMDAFEKLLKLNLKNQQEREIINVILHCALQEKQFNPYYAYLAGKFCSFARKHQICLQFSLWDKFKALDKMKKHELNNLASILSHLFTSGSLPISVLKVIHFSDMNKTMVKFFRQILFSVLLHDSEEVCVQVFKRVALAENLKLLREGLRLFMHHFLLRNDSKLERDVAAKLRERIKLAEDALNSAKRTFKL